MFPTSFLPSASGHPSPTSFSASASPNATLIRPLIFEIQHFLDHYYVYVTSTHNSDTITTNSIPPILPSIPTSTMNINPSAVNALQSKKENPTPPTMARLTRSTTRTSTRHEQVIRKSDDISPSPQRVFAPNLTDPSVQGKISNPDLSDPNKTATLKASDGVFDFGGRRDQGPSKRTQKLMPNLQDITLFFSRKSDSRKPQHQDHTPLDPHGAKFSLRSTDKTPPSGASALCSVTTNTRATISTSRSPPPTDATIPPTGMAETADQLPQNHNTILDGIDLDLDHDIELPTGLAEVQEQLPSDEMGKSVTSTDPPSMSSINQSNDSDKTVLTDPSISPPATSTTNPLTATNSFAKDPMREDTDTLSDKPKQLTSNLPAPPTPKRPDPRPTTTNSRSIPSGIDDPESQPLSHVKLRPARSTKHPNYMTTPPGNTTSATKSKKRNVLFSPNKPEVRILGAESGTSLQPAKAAPTYDEDAEEVFGASFAAELENITSDFNEMITVIDDLLAEVNAIDPVHAQLLHEQHSRIPDSLRETLSSDADGSIQAMEEYLTTIRNAIVQAAAQDTATAAHVQDGTFEEDITLLEQSAMETDNPIAKPQGCTADMSSPTPRTETEPVSGERSVSTTRLGAEPK